MKLKKESFRKIIARLLRLNYIPGQGDSRLKIVGKCPKCQRDVVELDDYYTCTGILLNLCDYKKPNLFEGEYISFEEIKGAEKYKRMIDAGFLGDIVKPEQLTKEPEQKQNTVVPENKIDNEASESTVKQEIEDTVLGKCPKCGNKVVEEEKAYKCTKCNYSLSKYFSKTLIEPKEVKLLLDRKTTNVLELKKKDGQTYKSKLILDDKNYYYSFASYNKKPSENKVEANTEKKVDENKKKEASLINGACPICKKEMLIGKTAYGCKGLLDNSCNFKIPFKYEDVNISVENVNTLLRGSTATINEINLKLDNQGCLEEVPF